jgi:hypothetical protein
MNKPRTAAAALQPQISNADPSLVPALILERRRMLHERMRRMEAAEPVRNTNEPGHYVSTELTGPAVRHGADNHMTLPSRVGQQLHYRDGRVEVLA